MSKILWFNLYRTEGMKLLAIIAGYIIIICIYDGKFPPSFSITMGGVLSAISATGGMQKRKRGIFQKSPEGLFLLPTSSEERIKFTIQRICMEWIADGLLAALLLIPTMIKFRENMKPLSVKESSITYVIVLLLILSCIHMYTYGDYMQETDSWEYILTVLTLLGKTILIAIGLNMGEAFLTIYSAIYYIFIIPLLYTDYIITKKHFLKMVSFYADYEYSRGIKKPKP